MEYRKLPQKAKTELGSELHELLGDTGKDRLAQLTPEAHESFMTYFAKCPLSTATKNLAVDINAAMRLLKIITQAQQGYNAETAKELVKKMEDAVGDLCKLWNPAEELPEQENAREDVGIAIDIARMNEAAYLKLKNHQQ